MTPNKILLFDLDGTLVESIPTLLEAFRETFVEIDIPYPGDEIIAAGIGSHLSDIFAPLVPKDLVEVATNTYRSVYLQKQRQGKVQFFSDARHFLRDVSSAGWRMGIVTTKLRTVSEELLLQLKAEHYFEVVVGSEDVQNCKPHPEPLLLAAKKLEVNPRSCIYIGDSLHDALSARSAETEFIGVLTGTGKEEELKPFGNVFKTLSDIKKYLWD